MAWNKHWQMAAPTWYLVCTRLDSVMLFWFMKQLERLSFHWWTSSSRFFSQLHTCCLFAQPFPEIDAAVPRTGWSGKCKTRLAFLRPCILFTVLFYLSGAFCLAGGQEKLRIHFFLGSIWETFRGILFTDWKKWLPPCKALRESYWGCAYLCVICVCELCLVFPTRKATTQGRVAWCATYGEEHDILRTNRSFHKQKYEKKPTAIF